MKPIQTTSDAPEPRLPGMEITRAEMATAWNRLRETSGMAEVCRAELRKRVKTMAAYQARQLAARERKRVRILFDRSNHSGDLALAVIDAENGLKLASKALAKAKLVLPEFEAMNVAVGGETVARNELQMLVKDFIEPAGSEAPAPAAESREP